MRRKNDCQVNSSRLQLKLPKYEDTVILNLDFNFQFWRILGRNKVMIFNIFEAFFISKKGGLRHQASASARLPFARAWST